MQHNTKCATLMHKHKPIIEECYVWWQSVSDIQEILMLKYIMHHANCSIRRIRIKIRIHLLAHRILLWDILRLPSSRRGAVGLYVNLTLCRGLGVNQPPDALMHIGAHRAMHCATGDMSNIIYDRLKYVCCVVMMMIRALWLFTQTNLNSLVVSYLTC